MEEAKRGPKRRRVECKFIEKESAREVTFSKRRQGLFRKAAELSLLCGVEIAVITYSPHGNPFAFAHPSTPDAIIDRYLSGGAIGPAAAKADAHRERYEEAVAKLEDAKREAETIAADPGKSDRWWEEEIPVDMGEEELERYVASLEGLKKLVDDRIRECEDLDFYGRLLAIDEDIRADLDWPFLAEDFKNEDAAAKLEDAKNEVEMMAADPEKRERWWEEEVGDDMGKEELEHYVASLEGMKKLVADRIGECEDLDFYGQLLATDMDCADLNWAFLAEMLSSC